jgi:hypothetical protein
MRCVQRTGLLQDDVTIPGCLLGRRYNVYLIGIDG